jgi:hypothetical protein
MGFVHDTPVGSNFKPAQQNPSMKKICLINPVNPNLDSGQLAKNVTV